MARGASRQATFGGNFGGKASDPIWFAALYLVLSLLYVSSMDSDIGFWDTGEMQTVPYILGLAHPNGFPTEIVLGWLFSHTVVFGSPAFRLTLLSTLCSAASPAIAFLIARKLGARRMTAFFCSILFAMTPIVWNHGTRVDVIDMAVMFASLAMLFSLVTATDRVDWKLFAAAFATGAALGTHLAVVFYLPACFAFLAFRSSPSSVVKRLTIFVVVSVCCAILYL